MLGEFGSLGMVEAETRWGQSDFLSGIKPPQLIKISDAVELSVAGLWRLHQRVLAG